MSGILSLFSHFLKIQDFFAVHCNNNFCINLSYLFYYKAETGKKTAWKSPSSHQEEEAAFKRIQLHVSEWNALKNSARQRQPHSFFCFVWFIFLYFLAVFLCSVRHCAMNELDVWEIQWEGYFVCLWVKEEEKKQQLPILDFENKKLTNCPWKLFKACASYISGLSTYFWKVGGGGESQYRSNRCDLLLSFNIFRKAKAYSQNDLILSDALTMQNAWILAHI